MLIVINGEYLNPSAITRVVDTNDGSTIHLADGEKVKTALTPDEIAVETGVVIGANPGFEAAWIKGDKVEREAVVAWRIYGIEDSAVPMVISGRSSADLIIFPDKSVFDRNANRRHHDIDVCLANRIEAAERKAQAASMADA